MQSYDTIKQTLAEKNTDVGNFNELKELIDNSSDELKLDKNYKFNQSSDIDFQGFTISNDNYVVDGQGYTIDGSGQVRIFIFTGSNITLKNVNIINAMGANGPAVNFESLGMIDNCSFINNTAIDKGGAVYINNPVSNSKINSEFINNTASRGGAIFFNNETAGTIINGYFEGNEAVKFGGALYFQSNVHDNIISAEFNNNRVINSTGGAIFIRNVAENNQFTSTFRRNNAALAGGGIFFFNTANNNNFSCQFISNVAGSSGGAIVFYNYTNNNHFTGQFINNTALGRESGVTNGNGGAITFTNISRNCLFDNCNFINNTAAEHGGAINYRLPLINVSFNSNFINNEAKYGGAISAVNGTFTNVSFLNNYAQYGGAIYFSKSGALINSTFVNNSAMDGGAILTSGNLLLTNSKFVNNSATIGTNQISLKNHSTITKSNVVPDELGPFYVGQLTILNVSNITYGEIVKISASVVDENNVSLNNGTLSVIINGKTYSSDVENGTATIEIPNLDAGKYLVDVKYVGNERAATSPVEFTVLKLNAIISAKNNVYIINYGGKYSMVLKDVNGKALAGKLVTFKFNGKNIGSAATNANGVATISLTAKILKSQNSGIKNLVIQFGDTNYNTVSKTVKITVNKEKTKILAKNAKFKKAKKVKKYTITLKNSKGIGVKKVRVTLKVKGKTYTAITTSKGKATFKINKLTKKGKYTATITFKGDKYYNKSVKKVKIINK